MKTLFACLVTALLLLAFTPTQLNAAGTDPSTLESVTTVEAAEAAAATALLARLDEIKEMDKSTLTGTEKKELRQEVRTIKADLKAASGGVYLSVGAIILLVVLIVLLL